MKKGLANFLKFLVVIAILGSFVWFLILSPMISFRNNEKKLEEAARYYYEMNSDKLPTGERVSTLSLSVLYRKKYLTEDFKVPYSDKLCSIEKSWVKVKRDKDGKYKYYVYLDCGVLKSNIDHTGPVIKLNGNDTIQVNYGEKYEDAGVSSVVDDNDGKIDAKTVTVKGNVDTSKVGEYELTYTAFDSLKNKSTVTRKVKVVKTLISMIKKDLGEAKNYTGNPKNNYVRLSNMYFRVMGIDSSNNVILVADEDVANVNFSKLEKWLDEVYIEHFTDEAKKLLVKSKFCNMKIAEDNLDIKECSSYTDKRYAYVPSVIDINNVKEEKTGGSFLKPSTMSWTGNGNDGKTAYLTRNVFYGKEYGKDFMAYDINENYGVRPKIVIKGNTLIISGDGTSNDPYSFGETTKAKGGTRLNTRYPGEYIVNDDYLFRIIEVEDDGTTKVISDSSIGTIKDRVQTGSNIDGGKITYDVRDKKSYGYFINNQASKYIDVSLFTAHEVEAPVYKNKIVYGEEKKVNKFKLKISPPNMYDMFSAASMGKKGTSRSYWLINTTENNNRISGAITDIGVPVNDKIYEINTFGVRIVGYVKSNVVISNGDGTYNSPYKLK